MIPDDQSYILRMTSGEEIVSARRALKRCASYMEDAAEPSCTTTRTPSRIWRRKLSSSHHDNIDEDEEEDEHIVVNSSLIHSSKKINDYFSEYTLPCYYDSDYDEERHEEMTTAPSRFPSLLKATTFIDPEDDDSDERTRQEEHLHDEHERHVFDFTDARDDYETMLFPEAPSHKEEDEADTEDDDDDDLAPWLIMKERSCCSRPTILSASSIPSISNNNKTRLLFFHDRVSDGNEYQERDVHGI